MSSRYEYPVYDWIEHLVYKVLADHFPGIAEEEPAIVVMFDTKKRLRQGRFVLGSIKKASDCERALRALADEPPPDYVVFLDKVWFMRVDPEDQILLIRHELSHITYSMHPESEEITWAVKGHSYEVFAWELADPQWRDRYARWAEIAHSLHDNDMPLPPERNPNQGRLFGGETEQGVCAQCGANEATQNGLCSACTAREVMEGEA